MFSSPCYYCRFLSKNCIHVMMIFQVKLTSLNNFTLGVAQSQWSYSIFYCCSITVVPISPPLLSSALPTPHLIYSLFPLHCHFLDLHYYNELLVAHAHFPHDKDSTRMNNSKQSHHQLCPHSAQCWVPHKHFCSITSDS